MGKPLSASVLLMLYPAAAIYGREIPNKFNLQLNFVTTQQRICKHFFAFAVPKFGFPLTYSYFCSQAEVPACRWCFGTRGKSGQRRASHLPIYKWSVTAKQRRRKEPLHSEVECSKGEKVGQEPTSGVVTHRLCALGAASSCTLSMATVRMLRCGHCC